MRIAANLTGERRALLMQIVRYGLTGGFVTIVGVAAYWAVVHYAQKPPLFANLIAYLVSMTLGYFMHGRFSFRDTKTEGASAMQGGKFFLTSGISFGLNSFFVWLLTGLLHAPNWSPIPAMIFVTPAICFVIYRKWVFA
jgi:putative flippase GtrA